MSKTFLCYLHKSGLPVPELRVVACLSEKALPGAILAELPIWGDFEKIDVYDEADRALFSFTLGPKAA